MTLIFPKQVMNIGKMCVKKHLGIFVVSSLLSYKIQFLIKKFGAKISQIGVSQSKTAQYIIMGNQIITYKKLFCIIFFILG